MTAYSEQIDSAGGSSEEIIDGALVAAQPERGLRWLDIGCGTGDLLRRVRDEWAPARLSGIDAINWLADDLTADVSFEAVSIEHARGLEQADRVMLVEVIEHLQAPWIALRTAARLVAPGGRIVVSTPNIATLRHRLELAVRGDLTSFRPTFAPHLSPALPHVTARVLQEEGLSVDPPLYAGADVVSMTGGRQWPQAVRRRYPRLTSISVVLGARAPSGASGPG
jgi:SAM-dependent methyltransferase